MELKPEFNRNTGGRNTRGYQASTHKWKKARGETDKLTKDRG